MASPANPNGLITFLSNELAALSTESKKKHPEVKEAADRLLHHLRTLKDKATTDEVSYELSKLDDTVRPFIFGLESKNSKLVSTSVACIQRLIMTHAVPETSIHHILKSFSDLVSGPVELQVKLLQSLLPLLTIYSSLSGKVIGEAAPSSNLHGNDNKGSNNSINAKTESKSHSLFKRDAYMLFQDLCQLTSGEPSFFIKTPSIPKNLGLELIECVVCGQPALFKEMPELLNLLKEKICPLVIKSFSEKNDFSVALRLIRIVDGIIKHFHDILLMECEIFLAMFSKLLEPECAPSWQRVLVLESFKNLFLSEGLMRSVFVNYDQKEHSSKVHQEILNGLARIIIAEKISILFPPIPTAAESPVQGINTPEVWNVGAQLSSIKVQCLEQLDKTDPPSIPETYHLFLAIQCILALADSQSTFILAKLQDSLSTTVGYTSLSESAIHSADIVTGIEMVKVSWSSILASMIILCKSSIDDDLFYAALNTYQQYSTAVGLLGLSSDRDTLIVSLCRISLPLIVSGNLDISFVIREISQFSTATAQALLSRLSNIQNHILDERGVMCLRSVLAIISSLSEVLDEKAWFLVLETLQLADNLVSTGRLGKKESSSGALLKDDTSKELSKSRLPTSVAGSIDNHYLSLLALVRKLFEATKSFNDSCFESFLRALCRLCKESAISSGNLAMSRQDAKFSEEKAFSLTHLTEIVIGSIDRILRSPFELWKHTVNLLVDIAHGNQSSPAYRICACASFGDILVTAVQHAEIRDRDGEIERTLLGPLQRLMGIGQNLFSPVSSDKVVLDEDKPLRNQYLVEVQKCGLETLNKLLQTNGQKLADGWSIVFEILRSVFGVSKTKRQENSNTLSVGTLNEPSSSEALPSASKMSTLVRVSFPSLQLICNDFLTSLDPILIYDCIETLSCFGSFSEDVNISLTAVGLLWSISDHVLTKRHALEKEARNDGEPTSESYHPRLDGSQDLSLKIPIQNSLSHTWTTANMDILWMHLLANLSQLCSDSRPEVRNSANQSLFRTIGMNGRKLTLEAWDECIWNVLFPLLERVKVSSERVELMIRLQNAGETPVKETRNNSMSFHHSRNTAAKQWDETKVLTLNGVTNSFITFFPVLIDLGDGFDRAWNLFLDYIKAWCLSGSTEVSIASLKSLKSLVRYPKDTPAADGDTKIASFIEKRQKSLWRVAWEVWEGIGEGIAFHSDEGDDFPSGISNSKEKLSPGRSVVLPQNLKVVYGSMTQETIILFLSVFTEIFEVIRSTFGLFELRKFFNICASLVLYHNVFPSDVTTTRYRADLINDIDNCSPLQQAVLDYLSGSKVSFQGIRGEPEATLQVISSFIRYPFVSRSKSDSHQSLLSPRNEGGTQAFTYMAFAKRSIQVLITLFMEHKGLSSLYSSGTFESIISALAVPMKAKYSCPSPGLKDTTPLWRSAANTSVSIVQIGLQSIREHLSELPPESCSKIYRAIVEMFDGFLLTLSVAPSSISPEELAVDEDFDISVLETLKTDVFGHFGLPHVSEEILKDMATVIVKGTKLYVKVIRASSSHEDDDGHGKYTPSGSRSNSITEKHSLKPAATNSVTQLRGSSMPGSARASTSGLDASSSLLDSLHKKDTSAGSPDIIPASRHNFAIQCIYILFSLCASWGLNEDPDGSKFRVARVVSPMLVDKMCSVLRAYNSDRPTYTRQQFPRLRNEEVIVFLTKAKETSFQPGILSDSEANPASLRYLVTRGNWAHLYLIYPDLCDIVCVIARSGRPSHAQGAVAHFTEDDERIVVAARSCQGQIGNDFSQ
ncbi:hypothetical protein HDU67_005296 [Dinochytrium kinnereticum]|nr:hypothetical protein HDU67_005296 [Dinochytrium kinnereticum]